LGQAWAKAKLADSPRHREYVTVTHDGRNVTTYVVYPEVSGKAPVVILIHEIFGLSDWMKLQADELAAKGYIVLAPDLLTGLGPAPKAGMSMPMAEMTDHAHMMDVQMQMGAQGAAAVPANPGGTDAFPDQDGVTKAVMSLKPEQVIADLNAVADYGKSLPSANGKLAVGGFCWGGGKTFEFATRRADLSAAFSFYGPPPPAAAMAKITAPVYGFYAGNDARIGAMIPQAILDMKAAGKFYEPVTYEGAGHGFMRAGQAPDATPANKKAFDEGFARMVKELGKIK
jgi:carboxymethylenebutenolidase